MRKAQMEVHGNRLLVLCNLRHLLESHVLDTSFGGSTFEADWADGELQKRGDRLATKCDGYGHEGRLNDPKG